MIGCVKQLAYLAGLFETRQMRAYDEDFDLLCYPDCQRETVCFDYSYYEGAKYEKVIINCQTGYIHNGNIGFKQFSAAVRALAMLAESYSNPYFFSYPIITDHSSLSFVPFHILHYQFS